MISRRHAYAAGVTRWEVRAELRAGRWQRVGSQSLVVHAGPLAQQALWWAAVFEVVLDLMGGVRSLGELEVARECRRRGLPEPTRQVLIERALQAAGWTPPPGRHTKRAL